MHRLTRALSTNNQKEVINDEYKRKTTKILKLFFISPNVSKLEKGIVDEAETTTKLPKAKFENDSPNEFTSGNSINPFEIALIVVIILIWLYSLRKFLKKFEKLRFTHYSKEKEISQKYRLHEPHNLNQVRVCRKPTDSVIYSRDPIKRLSIYPTTQEEEKSTLKMKISKAKLISSDIRIYESNEDETNSIESLTSVSKISSKDTKCNTKKSEGKLKKNTSLEPFVKRSNNFLDPNLMMIPSLVRTSLLDLHRRSVENLSIGMKSINDECTSISNPNIKKNAPTSTGATSRNDSN